MRFELIRDHAGEWRWRLRTPNGDVIADSSEGYRNRQDCENGIRLVRSAQLAPIVDMTVRIAGDEADADPALRQAVHEAADRTANPAVASLDQSLEEAAAKKV